MLEGEYQFLYKSLKSTDYNDNSSQKPATPESPPNPLAPNPPAANPPAVANPADQPPLPSQSNPVRSAHQP